MGGRPPRGRGRLVHAVGVAQLAETICICTDNHSPDARIECRYALRAAEKVVAAGWRPPGAEADHLLALLDAVVSYVDSHPEADLPLTLLGNHSARGVPMTVARLRNIPPPVPSPDSTHVMARDPLLPAPLGATWCRACGCEMDDHNDPRQGGACTNCGDCEGWL